jgi:hypothetical protein
MLGRPFVGVFGSIQPGVLPELGENREDGLLDRFLFDYPTPVPSRWTDDEISAEAREGYRRLFDSLRDLHMPQENHGDPDPVRIGFASDAKEILTEAIDQHREEMEIPGFPTRLKGPWSKLEAYLARLSLILAMARSVDEKAPQRVEAQDVLSAVILLDYFKNQARRVYVGLYGENKDDRLAEDVAKFLKQRGGRFKDEPEVLYKELESESKPTSSSALSGKLRDIARRTPMLSFDYGNFRKDGQSRRYVELTLETSVNAVNGVNPDGYQEAGATGRNDNRPIETEDLQEKLATGRLGDGDSKEEKTGERERFTL